MAGEFEGLGRGRGRPAKRSGGTGVVPVVVGLVVVGGMTLAVGYGVWSAVTAPPQPAPAARQSREDFRKALLGKSPAEVIGAIGKPTSADEARGEARSMMWLYDRGMTFDPVSQTNDGSVFVYFERGKVVKVTY